MGKIPQDIKIQLDEKLKLLADDLKQEIGKGQKVMENIAPNTERRWFRSEFIPQGNTAANPAGDTITLLNHICPYSSSDLKRHVPKGQVQVNTANKARALMINTRGGSNADTQFIKE